MHECSMDARQSESLKATSEQPDDSNPSARVRSNIQRLNLISALIREGDVELKQSLLSMFFRSPQPNSNHAHVQ